MARFDAELGQPGRSGRQRALMLGALGVVYGDIGTSPLYTIKQCLDSIGNVSPTTIYGVLSLITWSLVSVVTLKYVVVMMRADNRGEGGILALTALALRATEPERRRYRIALVAGLLGAALFYGDGVITPAISVLSAVEGLKVATPVFDPYVIPITIALLIGLFMMQKRGTAHVGRLFGPVCVLWFAAIALLGLIEIVRQPEILLALNPFYGLRLLALDPWHGFLLLGAVVLAVTGAEALYADMGHFGRQPIRLVWLGCVFPALLLNYFGQGALLLHTPAALENPFYRLAPPWLLYPMVVLAAAATIIASQAVISGAFSITQQAIQLGYLPRFQIHHTSAAERGQIYVPQVNLMLAVAVIALVLGFRSSDNLGAAYGIAVTGTMSLTTVLAFIYRSRAPDWRPWRTIALFGFFLIVDLAFFSANMTKIVEGGWFPLAVATVMFFLMTTWMRGRQDLLAERWRGTLELAGFLDRLKPDHPPRVPGTGVFMAPNLDIVPSAMLHNLKHNKVLHERVVLMKVTTEDIPHVAEEQRLEIGHLSHNFHTVIVRYGFMDAPNIPRALAQCRVQQFRFNLMETSFFIGREKIVIGKRHRFGQWRKRLFILMYSTMLSATEFFRIPTNRVVELGGQIEL
jgi:KUP system potassium uptake protein